MNSMNDRTLVLNQLHARLSDCRLCLEAGYDIFPRAIYSGGLGARIMTIGQAPGITEKDAGRPFNAGSGSRLFIWLAEAGIEEDWFRSSQYMSSVTKCYPGRTNSGSGDRVPSRAEQQSCHPYLEEEIVLINPALIIPIGRLAIGLYFPKGLALNQIIGTQKQIRGRWIVPLPHPSGASRWHQQEANRALIRKAIKLIKDHKKRIFS
ncbi:MAG: uracil-DNA glycosylase family protein [Anaerolineales bacterium]|jgi:uracil-DNA glycosylase family 4|nr:uracil-DNA glycosylase family protein [Anaerolineales bacterium]